VPRRLSVDPEPIGYRSLMVRLGLLTAQQKGRKRNDKPMLSA
jgi:hypothetical protein